MKAEFISIVKDGRLGRITANRIAKELQGHEGKRVLITIDKCSAKRSNAQNAYLHLLFTLLTDELNALGNSFKMLEVKSLMKTKFLLIDVVNEETVEVIGERIKGTSECNKEEISEFIENVIRWAAELQIVLPYPNEQLNLI